MAIQPSPCLWGTSSPLTSFLCMRRRGSRECGLKEGARPVRAVASRRPSLPACSPLHWLASRRLLSMAQQIAAQPASRGAVSRPALAGNAQSTRFVIGLEKHAEFQVFSLANPNRVIVDLPDVKMQLPPAPARLPVGLIASFRGGQSAPGQARVVIDVTDGRRRREGGDRESRGRPQPSPGHRHRPGRRRQGWPARHAR